MLLIRLILVGTAALDRVYDEEKGKRTMGITERERERERGKKGISAEGREEERI